MAERYVTHAPVRTFDNEYHASADTILIAVNHCSVGLIGDGRGWIAK